MACFTVGVIQEFETENVDLPKPKTDWPKRSNLEKPKNSALSHNAALRRDVRRAKLERSETGTRCGIALKRFVMRVVNVSLLTTLL